MRLSTPLLTRRILATAPHPLSPLFQDVPPACAGDNTDCPIIMMFHGHGGTNQHYSGHPVSVYNYGFIG